jgi:hypothetical protein
MKRTNQYGTANLFKREIPLTKTGKINKTFLSKEEKELYAQFEKKLKAEKNEFKLKQLEEYFANIK